MFPPSWKSLRLRDTIMCARKRSRPEAKPCPFPQKQTFARAAAHADLITAAVGFYPAQIIRAQRKN